MPIIKNILRQGVTKYQGLQNFDVLIDDEFAFGEGAAVSKYFRLTNFPSPIPGGNSFFSIEGSDALKNNVELKTEILDANDTPIFHFPVFNRTNPKSVNVSIEVVAGKIVNGVGSFTILGELDPNKVDFNIPEEFRDTYNVRVTGLVNIDTSIPNTRPILFYKPPRINVVESIRNDISGSTDDATTIISITGSGTFNGGSVSGPGSSNNGENPYDDPYNPGGMS